MREGRVGGGSKKKRRDEGVNKRQDIFGMEKKLRNVEINSKVIRYKPT